jgi:hypothetical protein
MIGYLGILRMSVEDRIILFRVTEAIINNTVTYLTLEEDCNMSYRHLLPDAPSS